MIRFLLLLLCSLSATLLLAQKDSSTASTGIDPKLIPEFSNRPLFIDLKNNKLIDLETARVGWRTRLVKLGRAGTYAELENSNSSVRIAHADTIKFIARVATGVDPRIFFELMSLSIRKDKREIEIIEHRKNTRVEVYEKIPFTISKVQDGVYILSLTHLAAGEYLFGTNNKGSYAFGID